MAFHLNLTIMIYPRAGVDNTVSPDTGAGLNNCPSQNLYALGQYHL